MRTGGRCTTITDMDVQHAVVWTGAGTDRFVGKLAMSDDEVILDGTTTTPERRHGCVRIPRPDIRGATTERVNGATAIRIVALGDVYLVEPVSGGRGSALSLVAQLSR
jgi:hypothetical protein